ncbi:hypothetical protein Hanom_Chr15g01390451 [Helianthus anomalus]
MELKSQRKMTNFKPFGSRCEKTNLRTKVAKLAKPQGQKWHFTLFKKREQKPQSDLAPVKTLHDKLMSS